MSLSPPTASAAVCLHAAIRRTPCAPHPSLLSPLLPPSLPSFLRSPDTAFYSSPRFVTHIDDAAIRALTAYYKFALPPPNTPGTAILDMCSSWVRRGGEWRGGEERGEERREERRGEER